MPLRLAVSLGLHGAKSIYSRVPLNPPCASNSVPPSPPPPCSPPEPSPAQPSALCSVSANLLATARE
jgi:hypothetical protein